MLGVSRGKIIFIVTVLLIVIAGVYMRRDLALTGGMFGRMPPLMAERLEFVRRINGREWHVRAENAESEGDAVRASSIDIRVLDLNVARSADVYAQRGAFDLETDKMWLYGIAGIAYLSGGSVDFAAARADYDMTEDVWFFSEGVSASDDKIHVTAQMGKVDASGTVSLGKGAHVTWKLE
jgi:hypothetical protein